MIERPASRTAIGAALLRAAHQLLDGAPKIVDDPVLPRLLGPEMVEGLQHERDRVDGPGARRLRAHLLARARWAEERLHAASARGARQYVILGAGLDTFAYRQPPWAAGLRIFEVDQPASQVEKRQRLMDAGVPLPPNLAMVSVDFERESLGVALARAGLDRRQVTVVSCLGVLVYLERQTIEALFAWAATLARGSEIVFSFAPSQAPGAPGTLASRAALYGEPWRTRLDARAIGALVRRRGFSRLDFLEPAVAAPWFAGRDDALPAPRAARVASATV